MSLPSTIRTACGLALAAALLTAPADAQWAPRVGVGYVTNAPHQLLGFSAHALGPWWGGIGIYADAKFDLSPPTERVNFLPDLTVREVEDEIGDEFFQDQRSWRSFNVALLRPVSPELMLYLGAGLTRERIFHEYRDPQRERGLVGFYWVEDPERTRTGLSAMGGALFRVGPRIAIQFGLESAPGGVTVGATYGFPLRPGR